MRSFIDFSKVRPQAPDILLVTLHPESEAEKKVLTNNVDVQIIEVYYREAIKQKLPAYEFVEVVDLRHWPNSAKVRVKKLIS